MLRFHCDPARPMVDCPTPLGHHRWEFPVQDGEDVRAAPFASHAFPLAALWPDPEPDPDPEPTPQG